MFNNTSSRNGSPLEIFSQDHINYHPINILMCNIRFELCNINLKFIMSNISLRAVHIQILRSYRMFLVDLDYTFLEKT